MPSVRNMGSAFSFLEREHAPWTWEARVCSTFCNRYMPPQDNKATDLFFRATATHPLKLG